ncbi:MAG: hypothetical protein ACR2N6_06745, partial [Miltoncostaeaceae bacterium]
HTFVSLLIHEGRSVPYVATQAGHSPRVCLERFAHAFADAEMGAAVSMVDAIRAARSFSSVRPEFAGRSLRAVS